MSGAVIGLDIGSSGCRSVVTDTKGNSLGVVGEDFSTSHPAPGISYQDPEEILQAVYNCIARAAKKAEKIEAIVLSSVFHSLLFMDSEMKPLKPLIPWMDTRAAEQAQRSFEEKWNTYANTACPPNSSYPFAKLVWFKENEEEILKKSRWVGGIKEFVFFNLTGKMVVDNCVASGTGIFDVTRGEWDSESIKIAGIEEEQLPPTIDCLESFPLSKEIAQTLGIPAGTPVIIGAGDGLLASLGVGAFGVNEIALMIGTSAACRTFVKQPLLDNPETCRTWCYCLTDNTWAVGTSVNNGGIVYSWFIEKIAGSLLEKNNGEQNLFDILGNKLEKRWPQYVQKELPLFLPFILSERGPYWDPGMKARYFDVSSDHDLVDLAQSTIMGIDHLVYTMVGMIEEVAGSGKKLFATGGFSNLEVWARDLATLFGKPLLLPQNKEAVAYGGCLLGLRSLGYFNSIKEIEIPEKADLIKPEENLFPHRRNEYKRFKEMLKREMG